MEGRFLTSGVFDWTSIVRKCFLKKTLDMKVTDIMNNFRFASIIKQDLKVLKLRSESQIAIRKSCL